MEMEKQFTFSSVKIDLRPCHRLPADAFAGVGACADGSLHPKASGYLGFDILCFGFRRHFSIDLDSLFSFSDLLYRYRNRMKMLRSLGLLSSPFMYEAKCCVLWIKILVKKCPVSVFSQKVQEVLHLIIKECLILRALGRLLFYQRLYQVVFCLLKLLEGFLLILNLNTVNILF